MPKVVFDMDGTLTEGHIDFADMRQRTREYTRAWAWDHVTLCLRRSDTHLQAFPRRSPKRDPLTLSHAHRPNTGIPQGDLFTVLEASTPEHIKAAMATILEVCILGINAQCWTCQGIPKGTRVTKLYRYHTD